MPHGFRAGRLGKRCRHALLAAAAFVIGCSALTSEAVLQGRIAVEISTRQGLPLSDVRLTLFRGDRQIEYVRTDSLGRALFREVPRGSYGILAALEEPVRGLGALGIGTGQGNVQVVSIVGGEEAPVDFTLLKFGTGTFEASVRDNANLPLANVEIVAYTPTGFLGTKRSNSAGEVRFDSIPFGPFGAYAIVPESIGGPGVPPINRQGMFFDAGHLERRTYTLTRCLGTITARVLDQNSVAVADYPVGLFSPLALLRTVRTNSSGNAIFTAIRCGEYFVSADPNPGFSVNYARGQGFVDGLRINVGSSLTPTLRVNRLP